MKDRRCCVCKTESEHVLFTDRLPEEGGFDAYDKDNLFYDEEWKVYVTKQSMLKHVKSLFNVFCKKCRASFKHMGQLKRHVSQKHNLFFCDLCLENRKVFLNEQKLYTKQELKRHIEYGEQDERNGKIDGHPECLFCHKRFYNDDEIFFHMYHSHERCHLCEARGSKFEFFKNYEMLCIHFDQSHYPCRYPECLQEHFVVFDNQLSLNRHILNRHSAQLSRKEKDKLRNITPNSLYNSNANDALRESEQNRRINHYQDVDSSNIRFMNLNGEDLYLSVHQQRTRHNVRGLQQEEQKKKQKNQNKGGKSVRYQPQRARGAFSNNRSTADGADDSNDEDDTATSTEEKKRIMNNLGQKIKSQFGKKVFNQFQKMSMDFQRGNLMATEYYEKFYNLFGDNEEELFDDLLSSMPSKESRRAEALKFARRTYHSKEYQQIREQRDKEDHSNSQQDQQPSKKQERKQLKKKAEEEAQQLSEEWPSLSTTESSLPSWGAAQSSLRGSRRKKNKKPKDDFPALGGSGSGGHLVQPPQQQHWTDSVNANVKQRGSRKRRRNKKTQLHGKIVAG